MVRRGLLCAAGFVAANLVLAGSAAFAGTLAVAEGYDLFTTDANNTSFTGLGNLMGVPLDSYVFPGINGNNPVNVGSTDTIIQRTSMAGPVANAGDDAVVGIKVLALQLETVAPVNYMGNGLQNYFVTLNQTASTGSLDITFTSPAGGTFNSTLDLNFDIHAGSLNGNVVGTDQVTLTSSGTPWGRVPQNGAVTIQTVNLNLDGTDNGEDFWPGNGPGPQMILQNGGGFADQIDDTIAPLPETFPVACVLLSAVGIFGFIKRRVAAAV
jgi:hypothetical protein